MKICHVASHEGVYRGGAVQLCRMAVAQQRLGHEVCVVVRASRLARLQARDEASWEPLRAAGLRVEAVPYFGFSGVGKLREFLLAGNFDVVHAHRDQALAASYWVFRGTPRPVLIAQRGTISVPNFIMRRVFRSPRVDAIVAVAEAVKESLVQRSRVAPEKIHVVYGSVELDRFAPRNPDSKIEEKAKLNPGGFVFGSLSAYRRAKGLENLLHALAPVLKSHPESKALFVGRKTRKHLRRIAERLNIGGQCMFANHQSDVPAWLSVMSVSVVAATDREGLSGVLRESLAMGIPVISTDCAGNREIVRDRETGLLVPPGDVAAMRNALEWAIDHPSEIRNWANTGQKWVHKNCSTDAQVSQLETIYREALSKRQS